MQFQVPQFIDVEDKIFGPLTFKQFIYVVGGIGISFVIYTILPLFLAIIFIAPILGFALALAFYKVNNKPFIGVVESAFKYVLNSKLYIWEKREKTSKKKEITEEESISYVPKLSDSKLKDLSWSLDVHKKVQ